MIKNLFRNNWKEWNIHIVTKWTKQCNIITITKATKTEDNLSNALYIYFLSSDYGDFIPRASFWLFKNWRIAS